jgi:hypothetical protein
MHYTVLLLPDVCACAPFTMYVLCITICIKQKAALNSLLFVPTRKRPFAAESSLSFSGSTINLLQRKKSCLPSSLSFSLSSIFLFSLSFCLSFPPLPIPKKDPSIAYTKLAPCSRGDNYKEIIVFGKIVLAMRLRRLVRLGLGAGLIF